MAAPSQELLSAIRALLEVGEARNAAILMREIHEDWCVVAYLLFPAWKSGNGITVPPQIQITWQNAFVVWRTELGGKLLDWPGPEEALKRLNSGTTLAP